MNPKLKRERGGCKMSYETLEKVSSLVEAQKSARARALAKKN